MFASNASAFDPADLELLKYTGDCSFCDLGGVEISSQDRLNTNLIADLTGANLQFSDLTNASLHAVELGKANLSGADLKRAILRLAVLIGADLRGADLRKARMNLSNFRNCRLEGADLRGIRGKYAIWQGSDWWNATLDEKLEKALKKKWPRPDQA